MSGAGPSAQQLQDCIIRVGIGFREKGFGPSLKLSHCIWRGGARLGLVGFELRLEAPQSLEHFVERRDVLPSGDEYSVE